MILRARAVLPITGPAIENGAVRISGRRIRALGRWPELMRGDRDTVVDLGNAVLLPGLVNAHCHLDYTHMAGHFPPPRAFNEWLKLITETKAGWDLADYAESWRAGARMLLRTGTTTVGDIEAVLQLLPKAWEATPLRVISFLELIGMTSRRSPRTVLQEALQTSARLRHRRCRLGLSPHAPYSTVPELLRLSAQEARRRRWPLCTHVAESALEFVMFAQGKGEMFDWFRRSGRDISDCGLGSPVRHLERSGLLGPNLLAAHANYLGRGDVFLLAKHGVSVVHCPRSHAYFRHDPFPLERLVRAGVNICLGTDSLASVLKARQQTIELNLFDEMRALSHDRPALAPRRVLRMATVNGARALGLAGQIGELTPGALADLIAVPFAGKVSGAYETVHQHQGPVKASLLDGQWAIAPDECL
jgi:cytosine/adenosine deaminase-related metal-dependent hydrolase